MTRVLIVGAHSFDSGKTHLATELGTLLKDAGQSVEYFKPISGHNYWYNFEHTQQCLKSGQLVSKDATIIKSRLGLQSESLMINPIHSLFVPARVERPLQNIHGTLGLAGSSAILVMQRFSRPIKANIDSTMLLAQNLIDENAVIIGYEEVGKLSQDASILEANTLEAFQGYEELNFESVVSDSFSHLERGADTIIIESFNDSAWPWEGLDLVDYVFVVSPGHIFGYDTEKYQKASYLSKRSNLPIREVTFGRVSDLLRPMTRIEHRPGETLHTSQLRKLGMT